MHEKLQINHSTLHLVKGDITDMGIEAIVYYARNDLILGSGFGNAIAVRGGPSIQEELKQIGSLGTTEAVVTLAGEMKTDYIIHAVGPKFQEEDLEYKLKVTILNTFKQAEEKGIKAIAFPPMGANFYGIPLNISAEITIGTIVEYLSGETQIKDVFISLLDSREFRSFQKQLTAQTLA